MNNQFQHSYVPYKMMEPEELRVSDLLPKFTRNWPWILFSVCVFLVAAYTYLAYKQPVYKIQASLLIQDEKKGNERDQPLKELDAYVPKKVVENETEILRSYTLMNRVVDKLHLDVRYFEKTAFGKREIYKASPVDVFVEFGKPELYEEPMLLTFIDSSSVEINEQVYPLNQRIKTPQGRFLIKTRRSVGDTTNQVLVQAMKRPAAVNGYLRTLQAEPTSKASTVVVLTLEDAVPEKGEAVLNQLIDEYNQAAIIDKNKVAANTLRFIEDRLAILSGELTTVEKEVERYKATQGITDLSTQAASFLQAIQQNDGLLNQVNIQLSALSDLQRYINNRSLDRGATPALVGLNDPVLFSLIEKLTQLDLQRSQLARTTSDQNPLLQTIDTQINSLKGNMEDNIRTMKTMLMSSQQQYRTKNAQLESSIRTIPQKERTLLTISRQQAIKNNLYTYLLQKREETAVSHASSISDSRTIDVAQSTDAPIKPVPLMIYGLFGFLGFIIPIGLIGSRELINTRVTRRVDVEKITQAPIIGELTRKQEPDYLVVTMTNQSLIAEQFRTLRASLPDIQSDRSQVLLLTSSISGEGKSFISLNLGASLALVGKPTVILDMDLRRPRLHKEFNWSNTTGISSYLTGKCTVYDILKPVPGHDNLFIIPSGPPPTNPSELLSGQPLKQLVEQLREHFDNIIIDTAPIGLVSDARLVAPLADISFFVVRHDVTPKNYLRQVEALYREQRFKKLNIILNAIDKDESYYYAKMYSYTSSLLGKKKWLSFS
ncbi:polysaccharide biosynthesis tyrosine autokinase [Fibrisoma montanum]|uniref:Polysaccharide biosynthesis tyrosine autokinase n=1 Tax=Fibrisoma montanum TaxID=2305895 RepID=A0A418M8U8_9BACT|nr:tyrosine-protein kinase family protein [Fibrisoma montanum]RIV22503.1 polysaccharide biosynthesis tyrosine autokinase [Fibrisoma montanum]